MPSMKVSDVKVGAILARPIEDSMGRILINAGETLNQQLLAVLAKRGIREIEVRPESHGTDTENLEQRISDGQSSSIQSDADVLMIKREMEERFHNVPETDSRMGMIRILAQKVLIDRISKAKGYA